MDFGVEWQAFPDGDPPGPVVAAETLADLAREQLDIAEPVLDRNPKMAAAGAPTLVGFPTYFWVTNVAQALGDDGTFEVTATAGEPGTNDPFSTATVTATTGGITISGSGGNDGRFCDLELATRAYGPGSTPGNSCSVEFTRASVGQGAGWRVTASAGFQVAWEGTEANGDDAGDTLDFASPVGGFNVPVAESQAVVNKR